MFSHVLNPKCTIDPLSAEWAISAATTVHQLLTSVLIMFALSFLSHRVQYGMSMNRTGMKIAPVEKKEVHPQQVQTYT